MTPVAAYVRAHRGIEIRQHRALDRTVREDERRVRVGHAAENPAIVRRIAFNLIRLDRGTKGCMNIKRRRAGWSHAVLLHLLALSPKGYDAIALCDEVV